MTPSARRYAGEVVAKPIRPAGSSEACGIDGRSSLSALFGTSSDDNDCFTTTRPHRGDPRFLEWHWRNRSVGKGFGGMRAGTSLA